MKRTLKKSMSILLAFTLLFGSFAFGFSDVDWADFAVKANAEDAATSGTCGDNLTWTLNTETGELVISGTGDMYDWSGNTMPWYQVASSIKSVSIEAGVTSVGNNAFYDCDSLASITIPDNVISVGSEAFFDCDSLKSVIFGKSVTSIGAYAFSFCREISNITWGESVTTIGKGSFFECDNLKNIVIPNSVKTIDEYAFSMCDNLYNVEIGNEITNIGAHAFEGCYRLYSVEIQGAITKLEDYIFADCSALYKFSIPESIESIGDNAFESCNSFESITIPESVTRIGKKTFYSCNKLSAVKIGSGLVSIGDLAFAMCDNITEMVIDSGNMNYSNDEYGVLFNKEKTILIQYPVGNKRISYIIPDGVNTIEDYAFYGCDYLQDVTIPDETTSIESHAFYNCYKITSIIIPDGITNIGINAFAFCNNLSSVTIGSKIENVSDYAFYGCNKISDVYYASTEAEWNKISIGSNNEALTGATIHYNTSVSSSQPMKFSQTHILNDYGTKYDTYATKYFDGNGVPLDGSDGTPDMCIPGLNQKDDMVPQGITYLSSKNQILISAYSSDGCEIQNRPGVIYALDFNTGKYVGEYEVYNADGSAHTGHMGGIAVSGNNLYITDKNSSISYIPLSELNAPEGTSKKIYIVDSYSVSGLLNGASTSYLSYSDGHLWTGNFYHTEKKYKVPASDTNNSVVIGFKLSGSDSQTEWTNLKAKTASEHTFLIPDSVSKIQGAAVSLSDNKMILMSSYGRTNTSKMYTVNIADKNITSTDIKSTTGIPMLEGVFILGNYVYTVTESASWYYNGYDSKKMSKDPTDVVWKIKVSTKEVETTTVPATKPIETTEPSTTKPVVTEPSTTKPVETTKPATTKPAVTTKPSTTKPTTTEPTTKPSVEPTTKPVAEPTTKPAVKEEIIKKPSTAEVKYGETLILHADFTNIPEGTKIEWSVEGEGVTIVPSEDGKTCAVTSTATGDATITAKYTDANGVEHISEQEIESNASFWNKIVSFFKNLFGMNRIIEQVIKF